MADFGILDWMGGNSEISGWRSAVRRGFMLLKMVMTHKRRSCKPFHKKSAPFAGYYLNMFLRFFTLYKVVLKILKYLHIRVYILCLQITKYILIQ